MSITSMRRKFGRQMRRLLWVIGGIFVIGIVAMYNLGNTGPTGEPPEWSTQAVATVNGEPLTRQAYERRYQDFADQWQQMGGVTLIGLEPMRAYALQTAIEQAVVLSDAKAQGIKVGNRELNQAIDVMVEARVRQLRPSPGIASRVRSELREVYRRQSDAVRAQLTVNKLQEQVASSVSATEADLLRSFRTVRARHILISTMKGKDGKARPDAEARARAEQVLTQLKAGTDFAQLARQYSEDPANAARGGDLGLFSAGDMDPAFERAAFSLQPGQISERPVKTAFGYHLIKVEAVRDNPPPDLQAKKAQYLDTFRQQRAQQMWSRYQQALSSKANVVVTDPELKAATALVKGKQDEAAKWFVEAVKNTNHMSDQVVTACHYLLGEHYLQQKQWGQAIESYEAALSRATSDLGDIYLGMGKAYAALKDKPKALQYYQYAAGEARDSRSVHTGLAAAYTELGRADLVAPEKKWLQADDAKRAQAMRQAIKDAANRGGGGAAR